jgi:hypothetical protein
MAEMYILFYTFWGGKHWITGFQNNRPALEISRIQKDICIPKSIGLFLVLAFLGPGGPERRP